MASLQSFWQRLLKLHRENGFSRTDLFAMLVCSFVCASFTSAAAGDFTSLAWVRQMSPLLFWSTFFTALFFLWAGFLLTRTTRIINWCLFVSALLYSLLLVGTLSGDLFFNIGVGAVLLLIAKYVSDKNRLGLEGFSFSWRASLYATAAVFLLFCLLVGFCTIAKYKAFAHGTFDFGIFCQMFEQMAKTGLPYTTVERSQYLSHFAVHFSPIYYLLLPGYMLLRSPVYLLLAQAVIVGLGVFPLRRICRTLGMSPLCATGAAALYVLYPTMANGCFYDFHENKFLSVLLLYMISFILEQRRLPAAVFALLVLCVKEDAFIYVAAVALWMLLTRRDRWFAAGMIGASLIWFVFACAMIRLSGGEIMSDRFANFSSMGGGLMDAVRTCFYNIGYLIREVFSGAETEVYQELTYSGQKLEFVLWLCVPLLFTPFAGKRSVQLVLLIPLLVVNLMPDWMYQFDIDFQYTYGTAALLLVSSMLTVSGWSPAGRRLFFCSALALGLVFSTSAVYPKAQRNIARYYANKAEYDATADALKDIPADASVTAYGYMMPHLYFVDDLHSCPDYYAPLEQTDYYVLDTRYANDTHTKKMRIAMADDYTLVTEAGYVQIYRLTESAG
ncbi:MAG: DUF2079 domain-containing protein [Clostridiales bacterium]|jgi:uncharacterized membrane protein|nr:DUF2079 domain-containing protein [Clostridiales bacterium]